MAISRVVSAILQFATLAFIARSSTLQVFGEFATLMSVGAICVGLLAFGFPTKILVGPSGHPLSLDSTLIGITVALSIIAGLLVFGASHLLSNQPGTWAITAATYCASEMIGNIAQNYYIGRQRHRVAEAYIVLRRAIPIGVTAFFYVTVQGDIFDWYAAGLATVIVGTLVALRRNLLSWKIGPAFSGSLHYWLANIWSMLQQIDVVIVNQLIGAQSAGGYAAAFRLASPIHIVTTSITSVMIPKLTGEASWRLREIQGNKFFRLSVALAVVTILCSPTLIYIGPLLYGSQYAQFGVLFAIFGANSGVSMVNQVIVGRLYAEDMAKSVAKYTAGSTILGLGILLFGAAIGNVEITALGILAIQVCLLVTLTIAWGRTTALRQIRGDQ